MKGQDAATGRILEQLGREGIRGLDIPSLGMPLDPVVVEAITRRRRRIQRELRERMDEWEVEDG